MTIGTDLLQIGIGIPKSYGDPLSAEQGVSLLPLIMPPNVQTGFTMDTDNPWQPGRPALKGGGVWANSALMDGRTLLSDNVDNVIETIMLVASAGDMRALSHMIATTQRFINQARQFSATGWQIEPVWIEWAAQGGYGSQYALIYNIEMSVTYLGVLGAAQAGAVQASVTLVVEREPAWRGISPGVSPRIWTKYWQNKQAGKDYDYTGIAFSDSGALFSATIPNRTEYTESTDDYDYPSTNKNWIALSGSDIPGDAPALTAITINMTQYTQTSQIVNGLAFFVALSSKPHTLPQRTELTRTRQRVYQVNMTDSEDDAGLLSTVTDNTDGVKSAASATIQALQSSGNETGIVFSPSQTAVRRLSLSMQRGKYIAFLRGKYVSGTSAAIDITFGVRTETGNIEFPVISAGFSANPNLVYLGAFTIPVIERAIQSPEGYGQEINSNNTLASIIELIFTLRLDAASGVYNYIDLILVPIDEYIAKLEIGGDFADPDGTFTPDIDYVTLDSTGYTTRGMLGIQYNLTGSQLTSGHELTGTDLMLEPGVDNNLILLVDGGTGVSGIARDDFPVQVDIVPRWYGVRDA